MPRRAAGEPRLDKDVIVATALRLLDEVGLDALTTRRLAQELGVKSPALYWHVKSKRELTDAMADAVIDALEPFAAGEGDPADWLLERARAFRCALLSHRDGARLHAGTRPTPRGLAGLEQQAALLIKAGVEERDALRMLLVLSRYTVGWVLEEQADAARAADPRSLAIDLDLDGLPTLAGGRAVLEQRDPEADFEFGLRAFAAGAFPQRTAPGS